ncbi:MAG TPA: alpha-L-fucosidase [Candidatus Anammoximicrobium sp.]|nr:alpha-L-fucosidase [Candidatus Anammoximicrobium sp.]
MVQTTRRQFVGIVLSSAVLPTANRLAGADKPRPYVRANTDWLAKCRFGIGIHWTAQTVPRNGPAKPFQKAVADFDLTGFLAAVEHAGADYVLFTSAHALQKLPAPNPVLDKILPGRTCERDLIGEMANALAAKQKQLLVYYNHSCNGKQDAAWEQAVGYHAPNKERFAQNFMEIVSWMGGRYRDKIKAWWFDSPYSLDTRGPHNSVTTDMTGFPFPWERFTVAAKVGNPARLVTYNAGVNQTFLYTTHQDYWAGELVNLDSPAKGRYLDSGLQWFGWTCLEDRAWVHTKLDTPIRPPLYTDEQVVRYVRTCNQHMAPMTFNVGIYQDGTMAEASVEQLHRLDRALQS